MLRTARLRYTLYGALASASLIALSAQAATDDGVFGDYFTKIIINCPSVDIVTGFNPTPGGNYGRTNCTSLQTLLGSIFRLSAGGPGQAVVGFNGDGTLKYALMPDTNWQNNAGNISYTGGNVGIGTNTPPYKLSVYAPAGGNWIGRFASPDGAINIGPVNGGWSHIYSDDTSKPFIFNTDVYSFLGGFSAYSTSNLRLQTNGTDRLTILATNGNVGIGTTTPTAKLTLRQPGSGWNDGISIESSGSPNIYKILSDNSSAFFTIAANNDYTKSIILVASTGNVGIGTNTPNAKLQVDGGPNMTAGYNRNTTFYANHPTVQFKGISDTNHSGFIGYDAQSTSEALRFWVGGTTNDIGNAILAMSIRNNGNVGIGTSSPLSGLHIRAGSATLGLQDPTRNNDLWQFDHYSNDGRLQILNQNPIGTVNPVMAMSLAGNVGIGTTTPTAKLDIASGGDAIIRLNKTSGTSWSYIEWMIAGTRRYWTGIDSAGVFNIASDASTAVAINPNGGNVGIGTNTPTAKLDVNGDLAIRGNISLSPATAQANRVLTATDTAGNSEWRAPTVPWSGITGKPTTVSSWTNDSNYITNNNANYLVTAGNGNALCFWADCTNYTISMGNGTRYTYGSVNDYSIKMQMDAGSTGRGFTWGRQGVAPIASLNSTSGDFQTAGNIRATGLEYGNGLARTESRDNAGLQGDAGAKSGFFETSSPVNYPTGATSWWHLIDSRHSNASNNYAMQIAGSFFDQNLYFRKTNSSATQGWSKIVAENAAGNVGIGTTTPGAKLTLVGNAGFDPLQLSDSARSFRIGPSVGVAGGFQIYDDQAAAVRMRIQDNGNIGIGTTTPGAKLDVTSNTAAVANFSSTTSNAYISLYGAGTRKAYISATGSSLSIMNLGNGAISLGTNGNKSLFVTPTGIGIGIDTPTTSLDIEGGIRLRDRGGAGKVLTSDADGFATWQPLPASGGGGGGNNGLPPGYSERSANIGEDTYGSWVAGNLGDDCDGGDSEYTCGPSETKTCRDRRNITSYGCTVYFDPNWGSCPSYGTINDYSYRSVQCVEAKILAKIGNSCSASVPACANDARCSLTQGSPTTNNQGWVQNAGSCGYTCINGYSGANCDIAPCVQVDTNQRACIGYNYTVPDYTRYSQFYLGSAPHSESTFRLFFCDPSKSVTDKNNWIGSKPWSHHREYNPVGNKFGGYQFYPTNGKIDGTIDCSAPPPDPTIGS